MTTLNLVEVIGEGRPYELKNGPAAGTKLVGWRVKDDKGTTYDISTKPDKGPPKLGPDEFTIKPSGNDFPDKISRVSQGGGGGQSNAAREAYWDRKEQREIEAIPRITRSHAQEMAVRVMALGGDEPQRGRNRQELCEAIKWWTDFFQQDANSGVGVGGGSSGGVSVSSRPPEPLSPAVDSSAASRGEKAATSRKLNDLGVPDAVKRDVVHAIAGDPPTSEGLKAINAACDNADYALLFDEQGIERPPFLPDTTDLPPLDVVA